eukprot:CAMPEP_0119302606 /NCGR_PEP_ID=MMETSP1333-20130426/4177_1 /TAXON_ID=418940 /ORGANISM="Scyphosphaera apsteinii, Strain RCC1455" /LENGTH=855 /DNA_ID=CAMNT_0007305011 /DNA_START=101 /DNA_END=2668 /DNA_ORIENTATION=-
MIMNLAFFLCTTFVGTSVSFHVPPVAPRYAAIKRSRSRIAVARFPTWPLVTIGATTGVAAWIGINQFWERRSATKSVDESNSEVATTVETAKKWHQVQLDLTLPMVRKSAHALDATEEDRIVAAWRKMTENEDGVPGTSQYFRLALIHGGNEWRSTLLTTMAERQPSYCVHGAECFPNWHRVYVLEFEHMLRRADLALGGDGAIGLPYWDWTQQPKPWLDQPMMPRVLQRIMGTQTGPDGQPSEGGLFHNTFLPLDSQGSQMAPREADSTLFYKTVQWTNALDVELARSLDRLHRVDQSTEAVLEASNHRLHSLALDRAPHGSVHVALGVLGQQLPGTEMVGSVPTAGFHPSFWLHHCNVDRVYESFLATPWGRGSRDEWASRVAEEGNPLREPGFPDGEWGRFEPFGINPATGQQYHTRDTFETAPLGYVYDSLYEAAGEIASRLRELPTFCIFEAIPKANVLGGSKALYVYVSDAAAAATWSMPADLSVLTPSSLEALPQCAGVAALFIFNEGSAHCTNCINNSPKITVSTDVTETLRSLGIPRSRAAVHVIAYDVESKKCMALEDAGIPPPVLRGPSFSAVAFTSPNISDWGKENSDDVAMLQALLNEIEAEEGATPLAVDGIAGAKTVTALRTAQQAAGLEADGLIGPKTLLALRVSYKEGDEEKVVRKRGGAFARAKGVTVTWRLAEGTLPASLQQTPGAAAAELRTAFSTWAAALPGVTFEQVEAKGTEQLTICFADRTPHNKMAFDGPGGSLAAVTENTLTFDSAERWELTTSNEEHPQRGHLPDEYFFKLLPVAVHEIGHLLGMGHSEEPADVMSPYYSAQKVALSKNDVARAAAMMKAARSSGSPE